MLGKNECGKADEVRHHLHLYVKLGMRQALTITKHICVMCPRLV